MQQNPADRLQGYIQYLAKKNAQLTAQVQNALLDTAEEWLAVDLSKVATPEENSDINRASVSMGADYLSQSNLKGRSLRYHAIVDQMIQKADKHPDVAEQVYDILSPQTSGQSLLERKCDAMSNNAMAIVTIFINDTVEEAKETLHNRYPAVFSTP